MGLFPCFSEFIYPFFYCRDVFISFAPVHLRVTAHDEIMGCETCSFVFPGVVSEFSYREICCPVSLSSIYELSQVCFNLLIHAFTLSICSRVECSAKVLFDPHGFTECFDKVSSESRVSVGYDSFGDTIPREEMLEV